MKDAAQTKRVRFDAYREKVLALHERFHQPVDLLTQTHPISPYVRADLLQHGGLPAVLDGVRSAVQALVLPPSVRHTTHPR